MTAQIYFLIIIKNSERKNFILTTIKSTQILYLKFLSRQTTLKKRLSSLVCSKCLIGGDRLDRKIWLRYEQIRVQH